MRHAFFKSLGRLLLAPFRLLFGLLRLAMAPFSPHPASASLIKSK